MTTGSPALPLFGLLGLLLVACDDGSSSASTAPDAQRPDAQRPDAAPVDGDLQDAASSDAAFDASLPDSGPPACLYPADCPGGDCIGGLCVFEPPPRCREDANACPEGEVCGGPDNLFYCERPCERDEACALRPRPCASRCPPSMTCVADRCINSCNSDADCVEAGYCLRGECVPYPDVWQGDPPPAAGEPGQLHAGVGLVRLDAPVGVSMAGYGGREGAETPYADVLGGSDALWEQQDVRAVVLSDEDDLLVILRAPLCFSTDFLVSRTAWHLQQLTRSEAHPMGLDLHDHIIMAGTHSHSDPARYWNVLPRIGFGQFGFGTFSTEITDRLALSMARAIQAALDDLQPASAGWAVVDDFDPERRLHRDRRQENPPFLDDRLFVLRVDDAEGRPMAGLINFAMHGTHLGGTWLSGDVAGGVEVVGTRALSARVGRPVPVIFLNGNAGDVSPAGDDIAGSGVARVQVVGQRAWALMRPVFEAIEPRADLPIDRVTRRVAVDYDRVGYDRSVPEFRSNPRDFHRRGGFQCGLISKDPADPPYADGDLNCIIDVARLVDYAPRQASMTALAAFRMGDLVGITLPGEPSSALGHRLASEIEADAQAAGQAEVRVMTIGYAQDHQFYLLEPEDWFRGGYETSMSVWGWRYGAFVVSQARSLAGLLLDPEAPRVPNTMKPTWWTDLPDDEVPVTAGPEPEWVDQAPASLPRGGLLTLRWRGGHPGADQPRVHLERWGDAGPVPAMWPGDVPMDDAGFESLLRYEGDYDADHTWSMVYELPLETPPGRYRFLIEGATSTTPYRLISSPLAVEPATLRLRSLTVGPEEVEVALTWPDAPSTDDGASAFDELHPTGLLWRHPPEPPLPSGSRAWNMIIGGPLPEAPLRAVISEGEAVVSETEQAPLIERRAIEVITSRDGEGATVTRPIADWPVSVIRLPTPPPGAYQLDLRTSDGDGLQTPLVIEP